jgi:hypothetical protein
MEGLHIKDPQGKGKDWEVSAAMLPMDPAKKAGKNPRDTLSYCNHIETQKGFFNDTILTTEETPQRIVLVPLSRKPPLGASLGVRTLLETPIQVLTRLLFTPFKAAIR